jgi:hypothetical protein
MLLRRQTQVEIVTRAALYSPLPTGGSWLARALAVSAIVHAVVAIPLVLAHHSDDDPHEPEIVDIELAPPPPPVEALPAEVAKPPEPSEQVAEAAVATKSVDTEAIAVDAGIDAAPKRIAKLADAGIDAGNGLFAESSDGSNDAGVIALAEGSGSGSGDGSAAAGSGSGVPAAIAMGSGSGAPGMDDQPAVAGATTSAGTAANLLAYMPPGHVLTALVRFDRMRGTEWAKQAEALFEPMPDYRALFGAREAGIAGALDMLVISTPQPRDVSATTLVMRTQLARPAVRDMLGGFTWASARGGLLGTRTSSFPNDKRVMLAPWQGWYVLAQPADLGALTAASGGDLETIEAKGKLPAWLAQIRSIAKESGDDKQGPALVVTLGGAPLGTGPARSGRYKIPDVGLGVTSLPVPQRLSLAMELAPQGWLVRGNIVFASEADATEVVTALSGVQQRIVGSFVLSTLLKRQHLLNVVSGLQLARTGARVSYATSLSIADARAVLGVMAVTLGQYFGPP